jgi:hypothetical protein
VAGALRARGVEPLVLDASAVPTAVPVTLAFDRAGVAGWWSELGELREIGDAIAELLVDPDARRVGHG